MAIVHWFLQSKGGVGKSMSAALLFQYFVKKGVPVSGYDTDPMNGSFSGYGEFGVPALDIMRGDDIDLRAFDQLVEAAAGLAANAHLIIGVGASCFVLLCAYLKESQALDLLVAEKHEVLIHCPVTGGLAMLDTLNCLQALTQHFKVPLVVWLNLFFGEIAIGNQGFYEFKIYQEAAASIQSVIQIPQRKPETYGRDFQELLARRQSFDAAIRSSLPIMTRSRLGTLWRDIETAIDGARLV
jgi:hypothetical protein